MIKRYFPTLLMAASAAMAGCSSDNLTIPNPNQPTPGGILQDPRNGMQFAVNGIQLIDRQNYDTYLSNIGSTGRESYNVFPTDGRSITGWYRDIDVNTAFGASPAPMWAARFQSLRSTMFIRDSLVPSIQFTAPEKAGATGYSQTTDAVNMFFVILAVNNQGAPTRIAPGIFDVTPFVSRDSVLSFISGTLDAGYASLLAGTFSFTFPGTGFAAVAANGLGGFNDPAGFAKYNRAMAARVLVYRASLATGGAQVTLANAALTAITNSFLVTPLTAANRGGGPGYDYSTAANENTNDLRVIAGAGGIYINPNIATEPEYGTDPRVTAYLLTVPAVTPAGADAPATQKINRFNGATQTIPVITNEELLLLRAEANYLAGNTVAGIADLQAVRTLWGLGALVPNAAPASLTQFTDDLLHERRFSLIGFQQRWFDMRRYGRVNQLPLSGAAFRRNTNLILPQAECLGRIGPAVADASLACPVWVATDPQNPAI